MKNPGSWMGIIPRGTRINCVRAYTRSTVAVSVLSLLKLGRVPLPCIIYSNPNAACGKIKCLMQNTPSLNLNDQRPKVIASLLAGFDAVANHIWLIFIPVLLDVFLWLGPRLKMQTLLKPVIQSMGTLPGITSADMQALIKAAQQGWELIAERINILAALRTYPVGIPSLMSSWLPLKSVLGTPVTFEIVNPTTVVLLFLAFSVLGILFTSVYFQSLSTVTGKEKASFSLGMIGWYALQLLMLSIVMILSIIFLGLPFLMLISAITLFNAMLGQISLFFGGLMVIWIIVPMIFSAHGVFVYHMPVFRSILTSIQMVRISLSVTGSFILSVVVISMGLDLLWQTPSETSWLLAVSILGHAFINTSLIAATFFYYRKSILWMQSIIMKNNLAQKPASDVTQS